MSDGIQYSQHDNPQGQELQILWESRVSSPLLPASTGGPGMNPNSVRDTGSTRPPLIHSADSQDACFSVQSGSGSGERSYASQYSDNIGPHPEGRQRTRPPAALPGSYQDSDGQWSNRDKPAPPVPSYVSKKYQPPRRSQPTIPPELPTSPSPKWPMSEGDVVDCGHGQGRGPHSSQMTSSPISVCQCCCCPRQRCSIFVAVGLVLVSAVALVALSISVYLLTVLTSGGGGGCGRPADCSGDNQVKERGRKHNVSVASRLQDERLFQHVQLRVDFSEPGSKQIYATPTFRLHMRSWSARLRDVISLKITAEGTYFVYSSISYNMNEQSKSCSQLPYKTWKHEVIRSRSGLQPKILLQTVETCCESCKEYHSSRFAGGVFQLQKGDEIYCDVSAPLFVFDKHERSYLGLYKLDSNAHTEL